MGAGRGEQIGVKLGEQIGEKRGLIKGQLAQLESLREMLPGDIYETRKTALLQELEKLQGEEPSNP